MSSYERPIAPSDPVPATAGGTLRPAPAQLRHPWLVGITAGLLLALIFVVTWLVWALPLGRALAPLQSPTLVLLDDAGQPFARRGALKEAPVDVKTLPPYVPLAFVAIEDRRFFLHHGIDPHAIFRAVGRDLSAGRFREGGSTITQQLAKNAFLSSRRTFRRKAQEALIALYLEARLSKAEILSRYISAIYFGDGVFGIRAAARHYFGKAPEQLTLGEAAMLAGLVRAPSRLSPTADLPAARARTRRVLAAMLRMRIITPAQAAAGAEVKVLPSAALTNGSWFVDWVTPDARRAFHWGYGEVNVHTTLNSALQADAERIVKGHLEAEGARMGAGQAALIAMRADGRVLAMVGGRDYRSSPYNRAVDARRQPGSAFKLFVYLAALRHGLTPDTRVLDAPVKVGGWSPENYESKYENAQIPLRDAFARSSNSAAVRVEQAVGLKAITETARDLGITGPLPEDATLALGSGQTSLLELTQAYAAMDAGAAPIHARGLAGADAAPPIAELGPERAGMLQLLRAVVTSGTGTAAALPVDAYGKTGTASDYRDAWFIGFAGDLVVGVWVGNDDNSPMKHVTGGSLPAAIWRDFMLAALGRHAVGFSAAPVAAPRAPDALPASDALDLGAAPDADQPDDVSPQDRAALDPIPSDLANPPPLPPPSPRERLPQMDPRDLPRGRFEPPPPPDADAPDDRYGRPPPDADRRRYDDGPPPDDAADE